MSKKELDIYGEDSVQEGDLEPVEVSSANRVINGLKKRTVTILLLCGRAEWNPPISPNQYTDDTELHQWVGDAIRHSCIILQTADAKINKVFEVSELLHFDFYLVSGVLGHEMTGVAKSLTAHLDVVNQLDVEHIATFLSAEDISASLREEADEYADLNKLDDEISTAGGE